MNAQSRVGALLVGGLVAWGLLVPECDAQRAPGAEQPYGVFAPWLETTVRLDTEVSVPGGPAFHVKIYDWVIGERRAVQNFPLEGFATMELKAGELETTLNGVTVERRPGEHWVVPVGARFGMRAKAVARRGNNLVDVQGVVLIRRSP